MTGHVLRGAYSADFGAFDDEPAHLVTGLMIRDWVLAGFPSPMPYAQDYYLHYPKVSLGQWPPGFYGIQAAWTIVFGASTTSLVTLMAALAALVALLVYVTARDEVGEAGAVVGGVLFLALPLVQRFGAMTMTEVPLALLCTLAVVRFGRYLDHDRPRDLVLFGLLAVAAMYTKGNSIALAGVPPLAIALGRRWEILRRPLLWAVGIGVGALCAPWHYFAIRFSTSTWAQPEPSLEYTLKSSGLYAQELVRLGGIGVLAAAVIGLASRLRAAGGRRGLWLALAAWVPSLLVMHVVVPSSLDPRHLVLITPAIALAAVAGARRCFDLLGSRVPTFVGPLVLLALFAAEGFELPPKDWSGHDEAARLLFEDETLSDSVFLIESDAMGEGAFVAAVALRDERPGHFVLRGSKVLGWSSFMGEVYEERYADADELARFLREFPVGVVAIDRHPKETQRYPHHDLLWEVLTTHPGWEPIGEVDLEKAGTVHAGGLRLYRLDGHEGRPPRAQDIDDLVRRGPWGGDEAGGDQAADDRASDGSE